MAGRRRSTQAVLGRTTSTTSEYQSVLRETQRALSRPGMIAQLRAAAPKVQAPQSVNPLHRRGA